MKIVLVYRKKMKGRYSLENVFDSLIPYIRTQYNIRVYFTGGWMCLIKDIFNLRSMKCDIYHIIGDINYFSIFLPKNKTILTIPDVGHYIYDLKNLRKILYKWLWIKLPIFFAHKVTTISEFSKKKISNIINKKKIQIEVIPCCYRSDLIFFKKKLDKKNIKILFIGNGYNKNFTRLIEAVKFTNWKITVIGNQSFSDKMLLEKYGINYKNLKNVNFNKVIEAYKRSDILCFISLHEGFGLPVIEANASGTPVIASNIEPINLIAGNAACLVNPKSTKDIKSNITKIVNNDNFRKKLIIKGLKNVKKYHPSIIAKQYCKIYEMFL